LLAYAQATDDFDAALSILDSLLDATQQRLPRKLEASLELARKACQEGVPRESAERLRTSVALARELGLA
jgi:hypothetical protein